MAKFDYKLAETLDDAVQLLNEPGVRSIPLAGGTDIFVAIRVTPPWFDRLVDIQRIQELTEVNQIGDQIHIGAAVTFTNGIESPILQKATPFLVDACKSIGGPAIQNLGTFGGNVSNAAACADTVPALVCLDAVAHLKSTAGERQIPVEDLLTGPHKTQIKPGELLTKFTFQVPPEGAKTTFIKVGRRKVQSISRLSIAVIGKVDQDQKIEYVRICPGAAIAKPVRFRDVEAMLIGKRPEKNLFSEIGKKLVAETIKNTGRRWSTEYKEVTLAAITERALTRIFLEDKNHGH